MAELLALKGDLNVDNKHVNQRYYTDAKDYIGIMIPVPVLFALERKANSKIIADAIPVYFESKWIESTLKDVLDLDLKGYLESSLESIADVADEKAFSIFENLLSKAKRDGVDVFSDIEEYMAEFKFERGKESGVIAHLKDEYEGIIKPIPSIYPSDDAGDVLYNYEDLRKLLRPNASVFENSDKVSLDLIRAALKLAQDDPVVLCGISPLVLNEIREDEDILRHIWNEAVKYEKNYLLKHATINESYDGFEIPFGDLECILGILNELDNIFEVKYSYKKALDWENKFELAYKILEFYDKNVEDKDMFVYKSYLSEEKIDTLTDTFIELARKSPAIYIYEGLYGREDINRPCILESVAVKSGATSEYYLKDEIAKLVECAVNEVF
jgi:hypothetical protein